MGAVSSLKPNMKLLVVLALVAAAYAAPEAEANADPAYYYRGWGGYARPYYYNRWGGYWKREAGEEPASGPNADASPEADPEAYWYAAYGHRWGGWGYGYRPYGWGYGYRGYRWW